MTTTTSVALRIPGNDRELTLKNPKWVEVEDGPGKGWQLGGWVDSAALHEFPAIYGTDRIIVVHSDGPEFVTLRSGISPPTNRGFPITYLKIPLARAPHRALTAP
jgi:hypothetical protein